MTVLKDNIEDSGLADLLEEAVDDLCEGRKIKDFSEANIESHLKKINLNLDATLDNLNEFLLSGTGNYNIIKSFLFNDAFGSINQSKCELKLKYCCEEITLKTEDNNKLDA